MLCEIFLTILLFLKMAFISKKLKKDDSIIEEFLYDAFNLKSHLMEYLSIEECNLDSFLETAKMDLAKLHPGDNLSEEYFFYKEIVGDKHLADLAAWHISSKGYIADTLKLQQKFARNLVLDFGGGIGTHALANAMSSKVEHVYFVDINQTNREFVQYRANDLGVSAKISFYKALQDIEISKFDTIVCLDVLEHLNDPSYYLNIFYEAMHDKSIALFNWYFYKGDNNEYPFHIDDGKVIERFFQTLQLKYLEVFHPILITTRAYKKRPDHK